MALEFADDEDLGTRPLSPEAPRQPAQSRLPAVSMGDQAEQASVISTPGVTEFLGKEPVAPRAPAAPDASVRAFAEPPQRRGPAPAPVDTGVDLSPDPQIGRSVLEFAEGAKAQARHPVARLENEGSQFTKGFLAGVDQTQGLLYGAAGLAGSALGVEGVRDWGVAGYERNMAEAAENAPEVESITKVGNLGELGSWAAYTMGTLVPTMGTLFLGGGLGALAGRAAVKKGAQALSERAAKQRLARGATVGAAAGTFGGSFALEGGGIYNEVLQETGQDRPGVAAAFGSAAAMMDVLPVMYVFKKLGFGKQATEAVTKKLLTDPSLKKDFKHVVTSGLRAAGGATAFEGLTEGLQTVIEKAAITYVDENKKLFSPENVDEIINAMAAGALMGMTMGAGGGAIGGAREVVQARKQGSQLEFADEEVEAAPPPEDSLEADLEFDEDAAEPLPVPEAQEGEVAAVEAAPAPEDLPARNMDIAELPAREARQVLKEARAEATANPTEAQKKAGNYKKPPIKVNGMRVRFENARGSTRSGTDADGKPWSVKMKNDYGYWEGITGADKDKLDVIVGSRPYNVKLPIHVIDQVDPKTGKFDEHKTVVGEATAEDALAVYNANYEKGWQGAGSVTAMSWDEFKARPKKWPKKPVGDLGLVKPAQNMEVKEGDASEVRLSAKAGTPRYVTTLKGERVPAPREFVRGERPDGDRSKSADPTWDSRLFVTSEERAASLYAGSGGAVYKVPAKPEAKILYEGSQAFRSLNKGNVTWTPNRNGKNLLEWASEAVKRAEAAGYDAVWFKRQADVGTAVINEAAFDTSALPSRRATQNGRAPEATTAPRKNAAVASPKKKTLPDTLSIDGVERPTRNSEGKVIHPTEEGVRNFWAWYEGPVDKDGRPVQVYHGGMAERTRNREGIYEFDPEMLGSRTGASSAEMGFFFSDSPSVADSYNMADVLNSPLGGPANRVDVAERNLEMLMEAATAEAVEDSDGEGYLLQITEYDPTFGSEVSYYQGDNEGYFLYDSAEDAEAAWPEEQERLIAEAEKQLEAAQQGLQGHQNKEYLKGGATIYPVYVNITDPITHDFKGGSYQDQSFSELIQDAIDNEQDGVVMENVRDSYDGSGETSTVYVALRPDQIKSATGNLGTFGQRAPTAAEAEGLGLDEAEARAAQEAGDIRFKVESSGDRDLVVLHNINARELRQSADLGGLAVPSIAITRSGHEFDDFGDVTLVGTPDMINPSNRANEVYETDAYSPTFPRVRHEYNWRALENALRADDLVQYRDDYRSGSRYGFDPLNEVQQHVEKEESLDGLKVERDGYLSSASEFLRYAYLRDLGVEVKTPTLPDSGGSRLMDYPGIKAALRKIKIPEGIHSIPSMQIADTEYAKALGRVVRESVGRHVDGLAKTREADPETFKGLADDLLDRTFDENGRWRFAPLDKMMRDHSELQKGSGFRRVDAGKFSKRIDRAFKKQDYDAYNRWVEERFGHAIGEAYIEDGRKKVEPTLDNIVKVMTRGRTNARGGGMFFGLGESRAMSAKKFKSLDEIKAARGTIKPKAEQEQAAEAVKEAFLEWQGDLRAYYEYSNSFDALDDASRALGEYGKGAKTPERMTSALRKHGYKDVPQHLAERGVEVSAAMLAVPVEYFEAKPQRAVRLNEFVGAVVPRGKQYDSTVALLNQNGITRIRRYKKGDSESRRKAVAGFSDVMFKIGHHGTPHRWPAEPGFPHGRPRLDKIGSGEGAQAYGWGFYHADADEVANTYGAKLAARGNTFGDVQTAKRVLAENDGDMAAARKQLDRMAREVEGANRRMLYDTANNLEALSEATGNVYTLDVPDADLAKYLDWDAPLSEQPEAVRDAVQPLLKSPPRTPREREEIDALARELSEMSVRADSAPPYDPTGREVYQALVGNVSVFGANGKDKAASERLRDLGIPGLKYLDQGSRGKGEGTRNYVTWDQDVLDRSKIVAINGEAVEQPAASVGRADDAGPGSALTLDAAKMWVARASVSWTNAPAFEVVETVSELPAPITQEIRDQGYPESDVHALYWMGTVYIVTRNLKTQRALEAAVFHEVYGHYGARQLFGEEFMSRMDELYTLLGGERGLRRLSEKYGLGMDLYFDAMKHQRPGHEKVFIVDEFLAHMQEPRVQRSVGRRVVEAVKILLGLLREWLRTRGFPVSAGLADSEIVLLLSKMERAVTGGPRHNVLPDDKRGASKVDEAGAGTAEIEAARKEWAEKGTDSRYFRKWFGDSKVVDENGEPLGVYHGTQASFDAFSEEFQGSTVSSEDQGFFFTNHRGEANSYAQYDWDKEDPAPNVMPVYLSIRNPRVIEIDYDDMTPGTWFDEHQDIVDEALEAGNDGLVIRSLNSQDTMSDGQQLTMYVAFRPEQIKSAIGNRGTFSPDTGNILLSQRAPVFYSQMTRVLADRLSKKGVGESYAQQMRKLADKGEFKRDEMEWSGVLEWLGEQKGTLTRDDVLEFVRGQEVRVEEVASDRGADDSNPYDIGFTHDWETNVPDDDFFEDEARELYLDDAIERIADREDTDPSEIEEAEALEEAVEMAREAHFSDPDQVEQYRTYMAETNSGESVVFTLNNVDGEFDLWPRDGEGASIWEGRSFDEGAINDAITKYMDQKYPGQKSFAPKYSEYTLPGGENYREVLLTIPAKPSEGLPAGYRVMRESEVPGIHRAGLPYVVMGPNGGSYGSGNTPQEAIAEALDGGDMPEANVYRSSHWDEPNVLAHLRLNDRTDAEGRRVLFIEEMQSDWAQEGRKKGFGGVPQRRFVVYVNGEKSNQFEDRASAEALVEQIKRAEPDRDNAFTIREESVVPEFAVPDMPFKQTIKGNASTLSGWAGLAMKRAIRMAAEGGYDAIAWTTGEQQAERYDLSKHVDYVSADRRGDQILVRTSDVEVDRHIQSSGNGEPYTKGGGGTLMTAEQIEDTFGKDYGERILAAAEQEGGGMLEGGGLKFGGEGMRAFYDEMLPAAVNKYVKKWGTKVGVATLEGVKETGLTFNNTTRMADADVHTLPLTDAMRDAAFQGQPMFKIAGAQDALNNVSQEVRRRPTLKEFSSDPGKYLRGFARDRRPAALSVLTLRHLADVGRKALPLIDAYMGTADRMFSRRGSLVTESHDVIKEWDKLDRDNSDALATVMHNATLAGVDPAEAYSPVVDKAQARKRLTHLGDMALKSRDPARHIVEMNEIRKTLAFERNRAAAYPRLKREYDALSPEAKAVYAKVRDSYKKRFRATLTALEDRLNRAEIDDKARKAAIASIRQHFEKAEVQGPYFPLARFGDHWVSVKDAEGNQVAFEMFESSRQARDYEQRMRAEGHQVLAGKNIENIPELSAVPETFVADILEIVGSKETAANAKSIEGLKDAIYQLYLTTLPDASLRKNFIHRKKTEGFSRDAKRAFAKQSFHGAYQLARLEHADIMQKQVDDMREGLRGSADPQYAADIFNELQKRHAWIQNPKSAQWANAITGIGFAWYLGLTPAAALVNLTQTAFVALPLAAAEYGWGATMKQMSRASREYFQGGARMKPGEWYDLEKHLKTVAAKGGKRAQEELDAFRKLEDRGVIDRTLAHDLIGRSETESEVYSPGSQRFMGAVGWTFHHAERFNREVTAMAVYRMARDRGATHAAAIEKAAQLTWDSHFDYSNANRARFMQSDWAKVLLMFRQFSLNMTFMLVSNAWRSVANATPEEKSLARKRLAGVLGMHALAAGAMGLPLYWTVKFVAEAIFDDEDDPWDFDIEFRNWAHETLGEGFGEALTKGLPNAYLGMDLASRVGLNELWLRDSGRDLQAEDSLRYWMEQLAGPAAGLVFNVGRTYDMIQEGQVLRGIEASLPKVIKDPLKALRYGTEGVTTMRGDPVVDEISATELLFQSVGFTPANIARQYDANRSTRYLFDRVRHRRQLLMNRFALAAFTGDADLRRSTLQDIGAFNRANPRNAISRDRLVQSLKNRRRYSQQAIHGISLPKSYKHIANQVTFGG